MAIRLAMLTRLKKCEGFAFLKMVDSIALQQSLRDLDRGFVNSKHNRHQSYRNMNHGNNIRIMGKEK